MTKVINDATLEFYSTTEKVGNLCANCRYNIKTEEYTVTVWPAGEEDKSKFKSWRRKGFQPRFGIDEIDWTWSYKVAEELSEEFDNEIGNAPDLNGNGK